MVGLVVGSRSERTEAANPGPQVLLVVRVVPVGRVGPDPRSRGRGSHLRGGLGGVLRRADPGEGPRVGLVGGPLLVVPGGDHHRHHREGLREGLLLVVPEGATTATAAWRTLGRASTTSARGALGRGAPGWSLGGTATATTGRALGRASSWWSLGRAATRWVRRGVTSWWLWRGTWQVLWGMGVGWPQEE